MNMVLFPNAHCYEQQAAGTYDGLWDRPAGLRESFLVASYQAV
jgi:hypothetical protein